jgi:prolyl 4-hydroxylase
VISAIINVAQDVTEDWPLEVIGHDGIAVNVTMAPGDMVLYESHSVIHGRPYPLQGLYYANLFLHFEPFGYTLDLERRIKPVGKEKTAKEKFEEALSRQEKLGNEESDAKAPDLPSYIEEGSEAGVQWRQQYIFFNEDNKKPVAGRKKIEMTKMVTNAHLIAASGNVELLEKVGSKDKSVLHTADENGWLPIHEAARSGHSEVIEYLIKEGADVNARTNVGKGASPLWWAEHMLPNTHPTVKLLRKHGAKSIAPGDP